MKSILLLFLSSFLACKAEIPPFQTKTFEFDLPAATNQAILYKVYLVAVPPLPFTTNLVTVTTSNRFTITNLLAIPQRVYITTSNVWGEGNFSVPYEFPTSPQAPSNIKPISTILRIPLNGLVESTTDLVNYTEQWKFYSPTNGTQIVHYKHYPGEPFRFFRSSALPASVSPPFPP
jgi:hypothetical protein